MLQLLARSSLCLVQNQPAVPNPSVQELTVAETTTPLQESRVAMPPEPRVVLPTLAIANPVHTAPLAPLSIVTLTSLPYPPPPGIPPLPNTDQPNHLLDMPVSAPIVPTAPLPRRSDRPHNKRTSAKIIHYGCKAAPLA
jgi:hypothetical protein